MRCGELAETKGNRQSREEEVQRAISYAFGMFHMFRSSWSEAGENGFIGE